MLFSVKAACKFMIQNPFILNRWFAFRPAPCEIRQARDAGAVFSDLNVDRETMRPPTA
jgi:hypothetical protein